MSVTITVPTYLERYTGGNQSTEVEGSTVGECLESLITRFPEIREMFFASDGSLYDYVAFYVNQEDAYPEQLARPVRDSDQIDIIYVIGGG